MIIKKSQLKQIIYEELSRADKSDIKDMISKELKSRAIKDLIEDELAKLLKKKDMKTELGEISKQVLKKLYKDLSIHHPYIIDRIKV
jgi:6-pyruvoyl-tetrahydropterin synthase